ncbi:MAG: hypothetical protein PHG61_03320 [Candidatus Marinimicrobia bacterium]|jgi:hypothetical protein|nr:hypothetical protein [Candidatus Neomarinimicrobiota bacterium]
MPDKAARAMGAVGMTAGIIALFKGTPVSAAEFDEALKQLLAVIAENTAETVDLLRTLASEGIHVDPNGIALVVPNTKTFLAASFTVRVANQAMQLPSYDVPDGLTAVIMSHPTLNPAGSIITVGPDANTAVNGGWPLVPGSFVGYKIKSTDAFYVSASIANLVVCLTAEYRG